MIIDQIFILEKSIELIDKEVPLHTLTNDGLLMKLLTERAGPLPDG